MRIVIHGFPAKWPQLWIISIRFLIMTVKPLFFLWIQWNCENAYVLNAFQTNNWTLLLGIKQLMRQKNCCLLLRLLWLIKVSFSVLMMPIWPRITLWWFTIILWKPCKKMVYYREPKPFILMITKRKVTRGN